MGQRAVLVGLALFTLALAPRWSTRDTYVTADEDNWMRRAGGFAWGLANGRPGRTYQNGHPGVTTMELAVLGQGAGGAERFADPVTGGPRVVTALPGFFDGLVEARRAFALATALLVALAGVLAVRLFGLGAGMVGGVILALDPFLLAHSQLVHMDAVLSGTMTLAALSACLAFGARRPLRWAVLGGAFTGLAVLTKAPAIFLGVAVAALFLGSWRATGRRAALNVLGVWSSVAVATFTLLWPSMWVNPLSTLTRMAEFVRETGGQPHEQGSFFLGQAVSDPGALFYVVALPLRLAPVTAVGIALLLSLMVARRSGLASAERRTIAALLLYAAGFVLFMTLGAKKFDRYILPAFPVLDLLAGVGLWGAWKVFTGCFSTPPWAGLVATGGLAVVAAWPAVSVHPHYLAYYSPLAGGAGRAVQSIPVGEGEGLREVARWLNDRPDAQNLHVVSDSFDALKANYVGGGEPLRDRVPSSAHYVVLYVYQTQIAHSPRVIAEYSGRSPELTVSLHGIEYARVYRGPRPIAASRVERGIER